MSIDEVIEIVRANMHRVRTLGNWPSYIDPEVSLLRRVPPRFLPAPGFDAGIACALGLIPENKQRLSAVLHAAYTPEAVKQVRHEAVNMDPDSETCWWLAACSVCEEGAVTAENFVNQLDRFELLRQDSTLRREHALMEYGKMRRSFKLIDGVPFAIKDGGMQGAYLAGYDWAVQYSEEYGIFFIGTYQESLGLEGFKFSDRLDDQGRPMSGPVHGSRQFVKASSFGELDHVITCVEFHLQQLGWSEMEAENAMLADTERQWDLEESAELVALRQDPED